MGRDCFVGEVQPCFLSFPPLLSLSLTIYLGLSPNARKKINSNRNKTKMYNKKQKRTTLYQSLPTLRTKPQNQNQKKHKTQKSVPHSRGHTQSVVILTSSPTKTHGSQAHISACSVLITVCRISKHHTRSTGETTQWAEGKGGGKTVKKHKTQLRTIHG